MMALFAGIKGFQISWKALLAGILALAIVVGIKGAYDYVDDLQTKAIEAAAKIETLQGQVNMARFERNIAEARAKELHDAQAELSNRLNEFNTTRSAADAELVRQREELMRFDLDKEISDDAKLARDRLNERTRALNRVLEQTSKF